MNIYILCGLSGSGKSTWARAKASETRAMIVNRDALRTMFHGFYLYDINCEHLVKNCAEKIVQEIIDCECGDIIIDECNLTILARLFWINVINSSASKWTRPLIKIILVWFKETNRNVEWRAKDDLRGYSVEYWRDVINSMGNGFIPPEIGEGFDEIVEVVID